MSTCSKATRPGRRPLHFDRQVALEERAESGLPVMRERNALVTQPDHFIRPIAPSGIGLVII
jgi:hypothetical protein